jgi:hypothetical protein
VPTMSKTIKELRHNLDSLTPSTEALMFSIYYASITSLDEEEVCLNLNLCCVCQTVANTCRSN